MQAAPPGRQRGRPGTNWAVAPPRSPAHMTHSDPGRCPQLCCRCRVVPRGALTALSPLDSTRAVHAVAAEAQCPREATACAAREIGWRHNSQVQGPQSPLQAMTLPWSTCPSQADTTPFLLRGECILLVSARFYLQNEFFFVESWFS